MRSLDAKVYTVRPGETLSSIARQFGFSTWRDIYYNPANPSLRARRPDPDQLRPGDQIMIPPSPQAIRQVLQERLASLMRLRQDSDTLYRQLEDELDSNLQHYKSVASAVDVAGTLAQVFTGLAGIAAKGWAATKLTGPALDAANKELAKQGLEFAIDPLKEPALWLAANKLGASHGIVSVIGKLAIEAFLDIQRPSWWAGVVGELQDGKSWSRAVNSNPEEQIQATRDRIEQQRIYILSQIDSRINETRALLNAVSGHGLTSLYGQATPARA